MPNYGFTRIVVHGPERARSAQHGTLASTARAGLEFTPVTAAPEVWTRDDHLQEATIVSTDGVLVLQTCLPWDQDALPMCGSLARLYPSLHFDGHFHCDGTWPEFTVSSHRNGVQAYRAHFDIRFVAHLRDGQRGEAGSQVRCYRRTPERDLAALDYCIAGIAPFLARTPVLGTWRRSDHDPEAGTCYLRAAEDGAITAVVFNVNAHQGHVLSGVDGNGGYLASETLRVRGLRKRFPELAAEFTRTPAVLSAGWKPPPFDGGTDWSNDAPF